MLPYASGFGLRNSLNTVPGSVIVPTLLSPNQVQLSLNVGSNLTSKDSQWLTLEVCREHQRGMCPRSDLECKYAHTPLYIETQGGRVMCCYDSIKGKCHRVKPTCKYFHPPQHLKDILIQNGKNNLLLKNLQMNIVHQQLSSLSGSQQSRVGLIPVNTRVKSESQQSPFTDLNMFTSPCDQSNANYFNVSDDAKNVETTLSTMCQTDKCLSNNIPPSQAKTSDKPPTLQSSDTSTATKRSLAQMYHHDNETEPVTQLQFDECSVKRPKMSETTQAGSLVNRDHQINTMGYFVNPFLAYQNPLATYLSLNNQTTLTGITANTPFPSMSPGFICSSPQVGINQLSIIGNLQSQHNLAMILNAANNFQGDRSLSQFPAFQ